MKKQLLVVCRHAPYSTSLAKEGLDFALAAGVFDQNISLLFLGEGLWQLKKDQQSNALGMKNLGKALSALPLYDIDNIYVEKASLMALGLNEADLLMAVETLDESGIATLLATADVIFNF